MTEPKDRSRRGTPAAPGRLGRVRFELTGIDGRPLEPATFDGKAVLVVNVASRCGLTPQYDGLERLHATLRGGSGFTVLGVPCNQFAGQEPGTPEEIQQFCSATYGATFPLTEKLEVNGQRRHPLYGWLTTTPDDDGVAGEIQWNFEKFVISDSGEVVERFRPPVEPEWPSAAAWRLAGRRLADERVTSAIESVLP